MNQEIEQLTILVKNLIEKLDETKKVSRLEELTEEIKRNSELSYLFLDDQDVKYKISKNNSSTKLNHLQKCVMATSQYKILEEYIDLYLAEHPEVIDYQNETGWTALMITSSNTSSKSTERTLETLLKHKANVNLKNIYNCTALMYASRYSRIESTERTVELLLKHGAEINVQDNDTWSALMYAAKFSRTTSAKGTVKLLLDYGANINLQDDLGRSALIYSSSNTRTTSTKGTVKLLLEHKANIDLRDKQETTALMYAAHLSNDTSTTSTVKILLDHGADINLTDNNGESALRLALRVTRSTSSEKTVRLLLTYGACIDSTIFRSVIFYHHQCTEGIIKLFLEKADTCDISIENRKLIECMWEERLPNELIELAIRKGAKPSDVKDKNFFKKTIM